MMTGPEINESKDQLSERSDSRHEACLDGQPRRLDQGGCVAAQVRLGWAELWQCNVNDEPEEKGAHADAHLVSYRR
jgi:hypothetical protein